MTLTHIILSLFLRPGALRTFARANIIGVVLTLSAAMVWGQYYSNSTGLSNSSQASTVFGNPNSVISGNQQPQYAPVSDNATLNGATYGGVMLASPGSPQFDNNIASGSNVVQQRPTAASELQPVPMMSVPVMSTPQNPPSQSMIPLSPISTQPVGLMPIGSLPGESLPANQFSGEQLPIERESASLAQSDPVFDGEVEDILHRMQSTAPGMEMQTFRHSSADMVPSGIENLRPVEGERDALQLQSQVLSVPTTSGNAGLFGAGGERSLTEVQEENLDFSDIMQAQRQANDSTNNTRRTAAAGSSNVFDVPEQTASGRVVDGTMRIRDDKNVENLTVLDVVIEGNGRLPVDAVRKMIKTMAGYPFQIQTVQEDARTLNQTGCFFSVTPRYQRKPDGVIVTFDLVERPVFHSIQYVGCHKIKMNRLAEETGLKAGDPVDVSRVIEAREKIKSFYQAEGFERASIVIAEGDLASDRNVVFIINEGVKQRVLKTEVVGSRFLSGARLKTYIESKPGLFYYIGGEFSREKLDADVATLLDFYQSHGFFNIKIDRVFEEGTGYFGISEPGSWINVKFIVSEGPRFKVNKIRFVGNRMFSEEELRKDLKLKEGTPYLKTAFELDKASVKRKYGNKGHLFAKVNLQIRQIIDKPGEIDLTYAIDEDKPVVITSITVDFGKDEESHTKTTTILKHLFKLKPGSLVTSDMIKNAENSIARPGFVNVNPAEGQTPTISIEREGGNDDYEEQGYLDEELEQINNLTVRGQSPGGFSYYVAPNEHRVAYPQTDGSLLPGSSPYGTSPYGSQPSGQIGVQQGSYTVPDQYQGYQSNTAASTTTLPTASYPTSSTVQPGSMPRLSIDTNVSSSTPAIGFFGQEETQPYATSGNSEPLFAPSSPYGSQPATGFAGTTVGATIGTPGNGVIPATTNPYNYYGDNGYGSVAPASGLFPSTGAYNDFDAPGSVTRPGMGIYDDYSRARAGAIVRVQEGKTGNLTMSVGINSDSGLVGRFAIEERNFDWRKLPTNPLTIGGWRNAFRGAGQKFLLEAMPGENYQRYQVSFQEPLLGNTRFSLGLNGFYYTRYYDEWRERRTGGGVTIGRAWTDRFSTSLSFNGANINVYDVYPIPDLYEVLGNNAQYAFGISATYDTRDNSIMPTEGGTLTVNAEQVLGTARFVRGGYDARRYVTIPGSRRGDGSGAWVLGFRSAANISESTTPIYERYYAGGFSTIRGFEYRGVTPRWYGYGIGGNFEFYNSVELCFPISADDNIRGVVFVDTGTVEKSISKWENEYRVAPGFGIRLNIPMMGPVPIAFDFAFPINKETGDITQMFTFNMGFYR